MEWEKGDALRSLLFLFYRPSGFGAAAFHRKGEIFVSQGMGKARGFQLLRDFEQIRQFMVEIYRRDWGNGVPAPFFEYALSSSWMDLSHSHRFRIWEQDGKTLAFVFHENPVSDIYFSLRPGHEGLAREMLEYAEAFLPKEKGKQRMVLFAGQEALEAAAQEAGYRKTSGYNHMVYDFQTPLEFSLTEGYRFVNPEELDPKKIAECLWKGFDHETEEGPWNGDGEDALRVMLAPHATPLYAVAIAGESGQYACFAGMWWTPENSLAYMEPLCTVPEHRHKGLAAAALSELYRRMKPLGATHMTGGANPFYRKIGYRPCIECGYWEKG